MSIVQKKIDISLKIKSAFVNVSVLYFNICFLANQRSKKCVCDLEKRQARTWLEARCYWSLISWC